MLLIIAMFVLTNVAYSQEQVLDFFNKDITFLNKHSVKVDDMVIEGVTVFFKEIDGLKVYFVYDNDRYRVISIMIPYENEQGKKRLLKPLLSSKESKNCYYMRTDMDKYLVHAYIDEKNKLLIFD